jgi:hypothetical protein
LAVLILARVSKTDDLTVVVREDGVVLFLTQLNAEEEKYGAYCRFVHINPDA